jgi:hypothetical protein
MTPNACPHCGASLPITQDAFCTSCHEPLDEAPPRPLNRQEHAAVRAENSQRTLWALTTTILLLFAAYWLFRAFFG